MNNCVQLFLWFATSVFTATFTVMCIDVMCIYFDKHRHKDPSFHKKKNFKEKEAMISQQLQLAEDYKNSLRHYGNADRLLRRSMKRQKSFLSNPELGSTGEYLPNAVGFPLGTTVDELFLYRKKRPPDPPNEDNLKLEAGSFQSIKSEYKRSFRKKLQDDLHFNSKYNEPLVEKPIENHQSSNLLGAPREMINDESETSEDEDLNKNTKIGRHLFRRPTQLKLEGEFCTATENAERFVHYLLTEKTKLMRHPTALKMEGEMETKTENRDKYVPHEYQTRPHLLKTNTNLHLEGILDMTTENREKFLPRQVPPRPALIKRGTNLHLEGDTNLESEYRNFFVEYKDTQRMRPTFPLNNLKTDGFLQTGTEKSEKFVKHEIRPVIPLLRDFDASKRINLGNDPGVKKAEYKSKFVEHPHIERNLSHKPKENLKLEGHMNSATENNTEFVKKPASKSAMKKAENNLLLEGKLDLNPEYTNAYVNFYKDAYGNFGIAKDVHSQRGRRQHLKSEGDMETNPEYRSAFVDFPRQRPSTRKPDGHMQMEGNISSMTEKRAQFVEHPKTPKPHLLKRHTELKLEGPIECYPEYRRAYIDYVTRDNAAERQPRLPENLDLPRRRIFDHSAAYPPPAIAPTGGNTTETINVKLPSKSVTLPVNNNRSRHHSLSPSSGKKLDNSNLSTVETRLFGPKLPKSNYSRNAIRQKLEIEKSARERRSRSTKRYGTPALVENMAYVSPVHHRTRDTAVRWKDEIKKCEKHSFVVLGNIEIQSCNDCNNNRYGSKQLFKEQKWMPSWYSSSINQQ